MFTGLMDKSWPHIPKGCSIDPNHDRAQWYTHPYGANQFPLVCCNKNGSWYATMKTKKGGCDPVHIADTQALLKRGFKQHTTCTLAKAQCSDAIAAIHGSLFARTFIGMVDNSWPHIPPGCSIHPNNSRAHWNTRIFCGV